MKKTSSENSQTIIVGIVMLCIGFLAGYLVFGRHAPITQANYFTVDQWRVRLPLSNDLAGLLPANVTQSEYSSTDQSLMILAPQLDANWTCAVNSDGSKATLGSISRTADAKRAGPYEPLVTKKIGNYTYGFEATLTTNCTKDPAYQELVKKFQASFSSLESF